MRLDQSRAADDFNRLGGGAGGGVWRRGSIASGWRACIAGDDADCGQSLFDVARYRDHQPEESGRCTFEGRAEAGAHPREPDYPPVSGGVRVGARVEEECREEKVISAETLLRYGSACEAVRCLRCRDPSTPHLLSLRDSKCCAQDDRVAEGNRGWGICFCDFV